MSSIYSGSYACTTDGNNLVLVFKDFLVNFLQEETFPHSKELLVMYYFQKGRYVEGIRLNELLKKDKWVCFSRSFLCFVHAFDRGISISLLN